MLLHLIGLAQERGARRRRPRRALGAAGAATAHEAAARRGRPQHPASTCSAGRAGSSLRRAGPQPSRPAAVVLRGGRQRPAVEAALGALEEVEWRETGSELEAALEELRLLRELRPPANARGTRPDRHVYLRRRGDRWTVTSSPTPIGPLTGEAWRGRAARALDGHATDDAGAALASAGRGSGGSRRSSGSRTPRGSATGSPRSSRSSRRSASSSGWKRSACASSSPRAGRASSGRTRSPTAGSPRAVSFPAVRP